MYPVGVEEMDLAFSHTAATVSPFFQDGLGDLKVISTVFENEKGDVIARNPDDRPGHISMPLKEYIAS